MQFDTAEKILAAIKSLKNAANKARARGQWELASLYVDQIGDLKELLDDLLAKKIKAV